MTRARDAGVTLVEVLVALALFSLIAVAGFSMLDSILRVRSGTEGRMERLAEIDRALLLVGRDLQSKGQAPLVWDGARLAFTRDAVPLEYSAETGVLLRRAPGGVEQTVLVLVEGFAVRLLDDRAVWHETWPPEVQSVLGLPPRLTGIEISLSLREGVVNRLFDLPAEISP